MRLKLSILLFLTNFAFAQKPVLVKKPVQEKNKIHIVNEGETLYSLLKKYSCDESQFLALNKDIVKDSPLKLGQKLNFPIVKNVAKEKKETLDADKKNAEETVLIKPNTKKPLSEPKKEPELNKKSTSSDNVIVNAKTPNSTWPKATSTKPEDSKKINSKDAKTEPKVISSENMHVVAAGETIFSLAKKYQIDISEFVEANDLSDNKIKIGQKLLVTKTEIEKELEKAKKVETEQYVVKETGIRVVEEGLAEVIKTKNRTRKYLALHREAPAGSIMKVTNEANGTTILVKIVGKLNPVGVDQKIMVKLSPFAYYKLRPKDSKLRAKVVYYEPI